MIKPGLDNYHKTTMRDHACVPIFWYTLHTWANQIPKSTYQASQKFFLSSILLK